MNMKQTLFGAMRLMALFFCLSQSVSSSGKVSIDSISKKGYRGMVEASYDFGLYDRWHDKYGRQDFSTTHGYLLNECLFIGGSIGYSRLNELETAVLIPVAADIRVYLPIIRFGRFYPFLAAKGGWELYMYRDQGTVSKFLNPSVGLKYCLGRKTALNFSVGYVSSTTENVALRLGFEF